MIPFYGHINASACVNSSDHFGSYTVIYTSNLWLAINGILRLFHVTISTKID